MTNMQSDTYTTTIKKLWWLGAARTTVLVGSRFALAASGNRYPALHTRMPRDLGCQFAVSSTV